MECGKLLIKIAANLFSPSGKHARLSVLTFHRVLPEPDPLHPDEPDAQRFDQEMTWLARWFHVLPLDEAIRRLANGTLPSRAAAITFDDGYANNVSVALPILRKHRMPATFFIATSFLNGGQMWNDSIIETVRQCRASVLDLESLDLGRHAISDVSEKREAIERLLDKIKYLEPDHRLALIQRVQDIAKVAPTDQLMMRDEDVATLHRNGMQIGAHTCTHPILTSIPDKAAADEIAQSKRVLEHLTNAPVVLFAYPNGRPDRDYHSRHAAMVRAAGFEAAVSTAPGAAAHRRDLFQIPRFKPWDRTAYRYGLRMIANLRTHAPLATH